MQAINPASYVIRSPRLPKADMRQISRLTIAVIGIWALCMSAPGVSAQEQAEYKKIKLERVNCDIGALYTLKPDGAEIGVSAIATGHGAEFRKWIVSDIRLNIDGQKIRPQTEGKFFVNKESLFRIPGAVVFAVIGAQIPAAGSGLQKGITRTGAAIGLGILALAAEGDIPGRRCIFTIDKTLVDRIVEGRDRIEITVEDPGLHIKEVVTIGLLRPEAAPKLISDYERMSLDDLQRTVDELGGQASLLEVRQRSYRKGEDPEYDRIQEGIDDLQTRRGVAYKVWAAHQEAPAPPAD